MRTSLILLLLCSAAYAAEPQSEWNLQGAKSSDQPFSGSVPAMDGNYKVTLTLGDPNAESTTIVKAELRRLMLENIHTDAGKTETRSFIVNIRTPQISTGGEVKLKPREQTTEFVDWDDKLSLEFLGKHPSVSNIKIEKIDVPTVYILGDSTVCDQPREPYASWGQMLPRFFKPDVAIANHAESGETLAGSVGAHRLEKVLSLIKPGDYLLIQFGHNDMKSTPPEKYKAMLTDWVQQVKAKGATPVVITSMNRYTFQGNQLTNSLKEFPDMVRLVAKEQDVPLIDLNAMSKTLYETLGPDKSIELFERVGDDTSKFDHTHHSPYGAYELAKCVVEGIKENKLDLAKSIVDDFTGFDPARPDAVEKFDVPASPSPDMTKPEGS
jgi:lysophospholipase L1-like esterase